MTPRKSPPVRPAKKRASTMRSAAKRVAKSPRPPTRRGQAVSPADVEAQLTAIERGPGKGDLELGGGVALHL
jgi:hypothetical protein